MKKFVGRWLGAVSCGVAAAWFAQMMLVAMVGLVGLLSATPATAQQRTQLTYSVSQTRVVEGDREITVTLRRTGRITSAAFGVVYSGTATRNRDFTAATGVSMRSGIRSASFKIRITPDAEAEGDETIVFSSAAGVFNDASNTVTVTIRDDDSGPVVRTVSVSPATVAEDNTNVTVTATLAADATEAINLPVTLSGTATQGTDYTAPTPLQVPIAAGQRTGTYTIAILEDTAIEPDETINVTVGSGDASESATITIANDDDPPDLPEVASLKVSRDALVEGDTSVTVTLTLKDEAPEGSFNYTLSFAGTATLGADYTVGAAPRQITIATGETTGTYTINVLEDVIGEGNETIIVSTGGGTSDQRATVTIEDDDIALTVDRSSVTEGDVGASTDVKVTVTLPAPATQTRTFTLSFDRNGNATRGDTATVTGADFVSVAQPTITIDEGDTKGSHTINVIGDILYESHETIVVKVGTGSDAPEETITITDDENFTEVESVTADLTSVTEGATGDETEVEVTVTMAATYDSARRVPLSYSGSATRRRDYLTSPRLYVDLDRGERVAKFDIVVTGDIEKEPDEEIIVTAGGSGSLGKSSKPITIADDDNDVTLTVGTVVNGTVQTVDNLSVDEGMPGAKSKSQSPQN